MHRRSDGLTAISSLALVAAPAALMAAAPGAAAAPALAAATPTGIWRDITSVGVTCLVQTTRGVDNGTLHDRLCDAVRSRAAADAPVPVLAAALGGEALRPGRVTLLVQASVAAIRGISVITVSIRPFRNDAEAGQFFAAAPRAVALDDRPALDAAIQAILAETLPWQSRGHAGRRKLPRQ